MANLRIAELDFDTIKTNLKEFLQDQSEFTDYDFEGSGLSVLIDLLAYNTHYNAYLANMVVNEMFLDSAVKRASAVSLAKHIGYTPASARGARATLNVVVNNPTGTPSTLSINRFTPFTTTIDGTPFTFLNVNEVTTQAVAGTYTFNNLTVVEGTLNQQTFVSVEPGPSEKFEITETDIDTSTLVVTVQNSATDLTVRSFSLAEDITGLTGTSLVYYLQENPFGKYEIFFGDDVVGKKLDVNNIINISYVVSSGTDANTSELATQNFTTTSIGGSSNIQITTVTNPSTASNKEDIASIKFKAPLVNSAKNRAVTATDYQALITSRFLGAESVSVWGGEDNDPPIYGKVLISLKPFDGFNISQTTKDVIINNILKDKKVLAIQPEFVDPEFFFVNLNILVTFNQLETTKSSNNIQSIIETVVRNYFSNDLQKFNRDFNKSKLSKLILDSDPSIESVLILLKLQKRLIPVLGAVNSFVDDKKIKFENGIVPGSLVSSRFFVSSANALILSNIVDIPDDSPPRLDGTGSLRLINSNTRATLQTNIGSVTYSSGEVSINTFTPVSLPNNVNDFRITASVQEANHNIQANRNQILVLDDSTLNAQIGREAGLTISVTPAVI